MDALAIISLISTIISTASKAAPIVFQSIEDARPFALDLWARITGQPATATDEAALDAMLLALTARIEKPLSPAQPGDPDFVPPDAT